QSGYRGLRALVLGGRPQTEGTTPQNCGKSEHGSGRAGRLARRLARRLACTPCGAVGRRGGAFAGSQRLSPVRIASGGRYQLLRRIWLPERSTAQGQADETQTKNAAFAAFRGRLVKTYWCPDVLSSQEVWPEA